MKRALPVVVWASMTLGQPVVAAGPLADPTRPPVVTQAPAPAAPRVAGGPPVRGAAPMLAAPAPLRPPPRPHVQAVQVPRQGPASALVDGRLVHIGDSLGGGTVQSIDVEGITLSVSGTMRRLLLLDGVERTLAVAQRPGPAAGVAPGAAVVPNDARSASVATRPPSAPITGGHP